MKKYILVIAMCLQAILLVASRRDKWSGFQDFVMQRQGAGNWTQEVSVWEGSAAADRDGKKGVVGLYESFVDCLNQQLKE